MTPSRLSQQIVATVLAQVGVNSNPEEREGAAVNVDALLSVTATTPPSTLAKADWLLIETAPKDEPVWLFGPSLIDEDYNEKGVVEGYWLDDLGWMGAVWNNEQDYWESKQINPTHWMPIPPPPTETEHER